MRVVILSGGGGAGATTVAAALVGYYRIRGLSVGGVGQELFFFYPDLPGEGEIVIEDAGSDRTAVQRADRLVFVVQPHAYTLETLALPEHPFLIPVLNRVPPTGPRSSLPEVFDQLTGRSWIRIPDDPGVDAAVIRRVSPHEEPPFDRAVIMMAEALNLD